MQKANVRHKTSRIIKTRWRWRRFSERNARGMQAISIPARPNETLSNIYAGVLTEIDTDILIEFAEYLEKDVLN